MSNFEAFDYVKDEALLISNKELAKKFLKKYPDLKKYIDKNILEEIEMEIKCN